MGENISPSLTSGKLTSIIANVVCTDWLGKMGEDYEPVSNFYYTNSWGMHICSLYLVLNNQHYVTSHTMLLRYGLKYVCIPLLLSENKISTTVFWGTKAKADNFCRQKNCSIVVIIVVVVINGNKVYTICSHHWLCCRIVCLLPTHMVMLITQKAQQQFCKKVTHNNSSLSNFYFHLRKHEHQDIKKWQNIKNI